ncbi:MAG: Acetate kinase [candidate division WS6 bacterium OLB20]|uniref:Acetate kinase n=1 Tax=candidate division WS6 bacterium OLB20 TaxID=1617426 RepID=A0A136LYS9_9BACT|nr:MAG: Acetate kinase [candidate division WS6 bacterium OLB20]
MATLVINAGSTTIKYKLFDSSLLEILSGVIDNTSHGVTSELKKHGKTYEWELSADEFQHPAQVLMKELTDYHVDLIGFRVVHGGEEFIHPTRITDDVLKSLDGLSDLAPLHNPPAVRVISDFRQVMPDVPMYAVFDTAFHASMPPESYIYSIPYHYYQEDKIRKYGFHGTSHKYVYNRIRQLEERTGKVITCHLGGGASITAIRDGSVLDTSMGFTPLEGLTMATRSGDIDAGVVLHMARTLGMSPDRINSVLNRESGLLGLSGTTSDMRTLLEQEQDGDQRAGLAIETYIYDIKRYIGSYTAVLEGLDALVFTAGVGQGSDVIRKRICAGLDIFGIRIDDAANDGAHNVKTELKISSKDSIPVWVIPTNEEWQIAEEVTAAHAEYS